MEEQGLEAGYRPGLASGMLNLKSACDLLKPLFLFSCNKNVTIHPDNPSQPKVLGPKSAEAGTNWSSHR
jgi:hypothetical protein